MKNCLPNPWRSALVAGSVALGLAWPAALAARPHLPKLNPKNVTSLEIQVDSKIDIADLVPGRGVVLDIVAKDKKGNVYSTRDGSLLAEDLQLTAAPGRFDAVTRVFVPEVERLAIDLGYRISATVGKGRNVQTQVRELRADIAALFGPEPESVESLVFTLGEDAAQTLLLPGSAARLHATAKDKNGRTFATGGAFPALPLFRLDVKAEAGATWDPARGALIVEADPEKLRGGPIVVAVAYRGSAIGGRREYAPDLAAVLGPEPSEVAKLEVRVGSYRDNDPLTPGAELPLEVQVVDLAGRSFSTGGGGPRLPWSRLEVKGQNLSFDREMGRLTAEGDCRRMVGNDYELQIGYRDRADLAETLIFPPDFAGPLRHYLVPGDELAFGGEPGAPGSPGEIGFPGRMGSFGSGQYGSGGAGSPGAAGRSGRPGAPGGRGPKMQVLALEATTADGLERLLVAEIQVNNDDRRYVVRPFDQPPLTLVSRAGVGGAGGNGGDGGEGGKGGGGYNPGAGGNGGDGGAGGRGGVGGPGGDAHVVLSSRDLQYQVNIESLGGAGGPGGEGGSAGEGGMIGSPAAAIVSTVATLAGALLGGTPPPTPPTPQFGDMGEAGTDGMPGETGPDGRPGNVRIEVSLDALAVRHRLPEPLKRCLLIAEPEGEEP